MPTSLAPLPAAGAEAPEAALDEDGYLERVGDLSAAGEVEGFATSGLVADTVAGFDSTFLSATAAYGF